MRTVSLTLQMQLWHTFTDYFVNNKQFEIGHSSSARLTPWKRGPAPSEIDFAVWPRPKKPKGARWHWRKNRRRGQWLWWKKKIQTSHKQSTAIFCGVILCFIHIKHDLKHNKLKFFAHSYFGRLWKTIFFDCANSQFIWLHSKNCDWANGPGENPNQQGHVLRQKKEAAEHCTVVRILHKNIRFNGLDLFN